jgi:hypothetical protein
MDACDIVPSVSTVYPRVAVGCRECAWELVSDGIVQHHSHEITNEGAMITGSIEEIKKFPGRRPGPDLVQTQDSLDHLAADRIEYACDWIFDDQASEVATSQGLIIALPYSVDLNDVPAMVIHPQSARGLRQSVCDTFYGQRRDRNRHAYSRWTCTLMSTRRFIESAISSTRSITRVAQTCCSGPASASSIGVAPPQSNAENS